MSSCRASNAKDRDYEEAFEHMGMAFAFGQLADQIEFAAIGHNNPFGVVRVPARPKRKVMKR